MSEAESLVISEADSGERLDRWVAGQSGKPRNQISSWIREHRVLVNGNAAKPATHLFPGDIVEIRPPEPRIDPEIRPEQGDLAILFEDPDLVVINKAAGVAVHPGAGRRSETLANFLLDRYPETARVGGAERPGIVHRLDIGTTGALVVARSEDAYGALATAFAERTVRKTYLAVVYGTPRTNPGTIDLPIGRHRHLRKQMQVRSDGRPALTHYTSQDSTMGISRLRVELETGRTHQIRVHLKALGHPLVGDPTYGEARWRNLPRPIRSQLRDFPRPALHAWRLSFQHPIQGPPVEVEAPIPEDMLKLWQEVTDRPWTDPKS